MRALERLHGANGPAGAYAILSADALLANISPGATARQLNLHNAEEMKAAWTEPGKIVTSGPFQLREQRSRDRIIDYVRNRQYYEAGLIALKEVSFLLAGEATTATNLYKSGQADLIQGVGLPAVVLPTLSRTRDFRTAPAFGTYFPVLQHQAGPI